LRRLEFFSSKRFSDFRLDALKKKLLRNEAERRHGTVSNIV